jgi:hypothetical protein
VQPIAQHCRSGDRWQERLASRQSTDANSSRGAAPRRVHLDHSPSAIDHICRRPGKILEIVMIVPVVREKNPSSSSHNRPMSCCDVCQGAKSCVGAEQSEYRFHAQLLSSALGACFPADLG